MSGEAKKNPKSLVCVGIAILALAGCARANLVNPNSVVEDGIEYYIQTDKSIYDLGENVEILYRVTNLSGSPVDIGEVLNCAYAWCNFFITDDDNTDIWEYLRGGGPPCGWIMLHLEPDEFREYQKTWDMISDNGTYSNPDDDYPVGPGRYNITGELELSNAYKHKKVPVSVSIEIVPEPASVLLFALGALLLRKRN